MPAHYWATWHLSRSFWRFPPAKAGPDDEFDPAVI